MNKTVAAIVLVVGALLLGLGLLFLCAAIRAPQRLILAVLLIVIGGGAAAWAGMTWRRLSDIEPKRLADRIVETVRAQGKFETTQAEAVASLSAPAANVQAALEILQARGEAVPEHRDDRTVYVLPNLKESKVIRRCPFCGTTFPVKEAVQRCPNCGGVVELDRT